MKFLTKLMLSVIALVVCASPVVHTQVQAQAVSKDVAEPRIFNYLLKMEDVDTADNARPYPSDTRQGSLIGFNGRLTATKRLPYKVGPGKVRVYFSAFPEGDEKELSVTIAGQKQTVIYSRKTPRYSWHELVFNLKEPQDMLQFEARSVDGQKARVIWYSAIVTNDPALKYVEVGKGKFKLLRQGVSYTNPAGNLVPNSGFEEGIHNWDVTPYKSNIMIKPSLLSQRAAHYQLGMDVGKIAVTSRWFALEKIRLTTFPIMWLQTMRSLCRPFWKRS